MRVYNYKFSEPDSIPDPNYLLKESFLNFPNIPGKPALVYVIGKGMWSECKTVKQTNPHYILVELPNGTIYESPISRKDLVMPLLDYADILDVCKQCRYRRRVSWDWRGTCNGVAEDIYKCFGSVHGKVEYIQDECYYREPLLFYQKIRDVVLGEPIETELLAWKKWDKYTF